MIMMKLTRMTTMTMTTTTIIMMMTRTPQKSLVELVYPAQISVFGRKSSQMFEHTLSARIGYNSWLSVSSLPVAANVK